MAILSLTAGPISSSIRPSTSATLAHIEDLMRSTGADPTPFSSQQKSDWFIEWIRSEVVERVNVYRAELARRAATFQAANLNDE